MVRVSACSPLLGVTEVTTTVEVLADGRPRLSRKTVSGIESHPVAEIETLYGADNLQPTVSIARTGGQEVGRTSLEYDAWGRDIAYVDTGGARTTRAYDGKGRLSKVTDPTGREVAYNYDSADARGDSERRGYATQMSITGVGEFRAAYDAGGNMSTEQMPGGVTRAAEHSPLGELAEMTYVGTNAEGDSEAILHWTLSRDVAGRIVGENTPAARSIEAASDQSEFSYAYDRAGRLTESRGGSRQKPMCSASGGCTRTTLEGTECRESRLHPSASPARHPRKRSISGRMTQLIAS